MTDLFSRALRLEVDSLRIDSEAGKLGLDVAFEVERDAKPYPNNCAIRIWNLSKEHRDKLSEKPEATVRLSAGYGTAEDAQQIFFGTLRRARTTREPPDYLTALDSGDGEKEFLTRSISKSWAFGTPIATVLKDIAGELGLGLGNVPTLAISARTAAGAVLNSPLTVSGSVCDELAAFCRSVGLSYSIQDQTVQLLSLDRPYNPGTAVLLTPETGLIGEPRLDVDRETKKTLVVCRALLQPEIVPGRLFIVNSDALQGTFAARKTRHSGETNGPSWYVDVEGEAI